ncbi:ABC transporter permease [Anaerophaga thermohalophila]|uniref:ABC transporter permease n=1 Tax=Anaerophaga thermohalophila TaxID=177400 RepID=UPI00037DD98E|nr:FtsX-like permease family protein [Anaerophaga thermohalophila]
MFIRFKERPSEEIFDFVEAKWSEFSPENAPFMITSLDKEFAKLYRTEKQSQTILVFFTVIAILVSVLGFLGLATYVAMQRTKEVGIRKVYGSSEESIIYMLTVNLLKWVVFACIIAVPVSWIYLENWLENFAFRINLRADIFLLASFLALAVGFVSVIFQAWSAAVTNPVNSLKQE